MDVWFAVEGAVTAKESGQTHEQREWEFEDETRLLAWEGLGAAGRAPAGTDGGVLGGR